MSNLRKAISLGLFGLVAGGFIALSAQAQQSMGMGDGNGMGHGHGQANGEGMGQGMMGKMPTFSDFDVDGDGQIIETEFIEGHAKKMSEMAAEGHQMKHADHAPGFSDIDTNADGSISEDEFAAHQAAHHQQMQKDESTKVQ